MEEGGGKRRLTIVPSRAPSWSMFGGEWSVKAITEQQVKRHFPPLPSPSRLTHKYAQPDGNQDGVPFPLRKFRRVFRVMYVGLGVALQQRGPLVGRERWRHFAKVRRPLAKESAGSGAARAGARGSGE